VGRRGQELIASEDAGISAIPMQQELAMVLLMQARFKARFSWISKHKIFTEKDVTC
jgi:hypothetical protein